MTSAHHNKVAELERASKSGDLHALAQIGVYYLIGHLVDRDISRGFEHIERAANQGEIASQTLLATLHACGMGTDENWDEAYNWLVIAAQNGDPKALGQITHFLSELTQPGTKMTWQDIRDKLNTIQIDEPGQTLIHHTKPHIRTIENFIDTRTCAYVINQSAPRMQRAYVNDGTGGAILDETRTNSSMSFFPLDNDLVIQKINKRISDVVGMPISYGEALSALHYTPGQAYKDHHDFFDPSLKAHALHLKEGGQRVKTFLIYLNDNYEGGETHFQQLDWQYKGKTGDAILFENVEDNGTLIRSSLHAGMPTKSGEKWLLSKWLKDQPQY